jgi:SNF family Na+-dependent transporter
LKDGIEMVAKICMPLLLFFGLFLVYESFTLKAGTEGAYFDGIVGINFMWTPQFDSLLNPKVWLSAAGQVFFTLSLGMGCVNTYASYMKKNQDVTLNSMTAGFLNEFTEIVIDPERRFRSWFQNNAFLVQSVGWSNCYIVWSCIFWFAVFC